MIRLDTKNMLLCTTNVVFIAMDIPRSGKTFRIVKTVKKTMFSLQFSPIIS